MHVIRDISDTSSYWGASWVFGCFPDVHMICDAPIGCYNLLGVAVTNYTDALAHMHNLTPTSIREEDVINGTAPALQRTLNELRELGMLENKKLIVLSTAESEMISADHTRYLATLEPDARFFWSQSLEQDEWVGRERALLFCWEQYGKPAASTAAPAPYSVNIIGPSLGCFNSTADLYEIKRLAEGIGATVNLVYPYESSLADTPRLSEAMVNIVMYREFGTQLAQVLGKPYLFAPFGVFGTTSFLHELAQLLGIPQEQVDTFVAKEKRGTLRVVWDMWRGPQSDWFATVDYAVVAARSYVVGLQAYLTGELGVKLAFASGRPLAEGEPDNIQIRRQLHKRAPAFVFGSINEKIYLSEANAKATFYIPATFPGPVVRRTTGTPFMGFAGAAYLMQELVNRFYESVFNYLPVETLDGAGMTERDAAGNAYVQTMPWTKEAGERLSRAMEDVPYLARISASRTLRLAAEQAARTSGAAEVTVEQVEAALAAGQ
ncbi:MAG: chlorophyllide reductase subunit Z [Chloroflexaceae bacterium]|nr:chlorophyllide reductase subunit Z [Chloroflexaceae bacterium]NJO07700.1 chlorophyllide reductase subunit Z [Chloroflexaceae bacterium]